MKDSHPDPFVCIGIKFFLHQIYTKFIERKRTTIMLQKYNNINNLKTTKKNK